MPINCITGSHLQNCIMAIARCLIEREKSANIQLKPDQIVQLVSGAQNKYQLLKNGNFILALDLARDVVAAMVFLKGMRTQSLQSAGYHQMMSEVPRGTSALHDPLIDVAMEPLQVPELEQGSF